MDKIVGAIGSLAQGQGQNQGQQQQQQQQGNNSQQSGSGNLLGNLGNALNGVAGGGKESEKDEDLLDKAVDLVQEKVLKQGPQDNESAIEQATDEKISDFIRDKYKSATGTDFPIADKPTKLG